MPIFRPPQFLNKSDAKESTKLSEPEIIDFLNLNNSDYVSARDALKNSDLYSIIYQLSSDLASVTLTAERPQIQAIIDNPTRTSNAHAFWQCIFAQLLLAGEAAAYRWRNVNGLDIRLEYLRPSQFTTYVLDDGSGLVYNVTFDEPEIGIKRSVPQSDMIHFRLLSDNGGKTGISPLEALCNELKIKKTSNKLTLAALDRSISAPGILSIEHGGLLDWKMKAKHSRQFMKQVNDSEGGPVVLDSLEKYQPLEMKADVAKLLSQTDWTGRQIAKVYGVPDSYLNGQGDQQSNIDQIKGMYANALNRYIQSILSELKNKFNTRITSNIRPVIDPLGDSYANALANISKNGVLAGNQVTYILQQTGYLPDDLPKPSNFNKVKEGDTNDKKTSN